MSPPLHVQIISGSASVALLAMGIRNVVAPGACLSFLPFFGKSEHKLQSYFWGTSNSNELVPGQKALSKLSGWMLVTLAVTKLTTVFSNTNEGTFLRRNLFIALGSIQLLGSIAVTTIGDTQSKAKESVVAGPASFYQIAILLGGEGLVLLHDALMRNRPIKP
ncbi:hypothetical protein FRACYDRAFT_269609 [Fragilariopsis cylindrus CCMP1102]|uniref:Uncharacterized protein n=1 Tax=Fragilariopsis cylindrus CCMP1102 TaxID=635003 RepID=A0A1E7F8T0_9STRA|nr:hypothetical protein FRACYDRAFT_269609 [Fragilariopsis cylindrus CCMP1102]|eukprot:OEU14580.1 hypothetical protein FRACYDRAFT_269609 [Fragilariopsis cylindrus CCMP1102]